MELLHRYHAPHWDKFALLRQLASQLVPVLTTDETMPVYEDDGDDAEATDSSTMSNDQLSFRLDRALRESDPRPAPPSIPPPPSIVADTDNQIAVLLPKDEQMQAVLQAVATVSLPPGIVQSNPYSIRINNEDPLLLQRVMAVVLPALQRLGQVHITPTTPDQADVLGLERVMTMRLNPAVNSNAARQLSQPLDVVPKRRRAWD